MDLEADPQFRDFKVCFYDSQLETNYWTLFVSFYGSVYYINMDSINLPMDS